MCGGDLAVRRLVALGRDFHKHPAALNENHPSGYAVDGAPMMT